MKSILQKLSHSRSRIKFRYEASADLLKRYRSFWLYFWGIRKLISLPDLKPHESEFLPAALSLQTAPVLPLSRWIARLIVFLLVFTLLWSYFGRMDVIISTTGKVISSQRNKIISVVEPGKITAIHVRDGQEVRAGDILLEFDAKMIESEILRSNVDENTALIKIARAQALLNSLDLNKLQKIPVLNTLPAHMISGANTHLESQWNEFKSKRLRLLDEVERYSAQLKFASIRANDYKLLAESKDVSVHSWLEKEQELLELRGRMADANNQLAILQTDLRRSAEEELAEGRRVSAIAFQDASRAKAHAGLLKLTSPVTGVVQQLSVHTVGGAVMAGQSLMVIVPSRDQIEVEAFVENKDVGFIQVGQKASVKIEAFDFTKYGLIDGVVSQVSNDSVDPNLTHTASNTFGKQSNDSGSDKEGGYSSKSPVYSVKILLNETKLRVNDRDADLKIGMIASAEIKSGHRRIIEYFLAPLLRRTHESLNER